MDAYDVVIVGGGPVGMWLAAELHRGGVRPVVLERRAERPPYSKALTIYPRTVEQFAMRGLVDRWLAEGTPVPSSHFALLKNRLDFSFLPTRYPFTLFLPQRRTEELLEEHLAELGVPYLRRHAVTGLRQDEAGVDLDVDSPGGPAVVRAAYAVGCDGATSVVRDAAGIDFEGTPDTWRTILGDIELADPPQAPTLTLNQPGGSMYMVAIGGGRYRLAVIDHATLYDPLDKPATFAELRASALRLAGTDFGMRETPDAWLSRVGNAARQAARYRAGRVLLAGDAAHIHYPAGGTGPEPRAAGRHQPGVEAGRRDPRLGAARPAGQLPRRTVPGRPRRDRRLPGPVRADSPTRPGRASRCGTGSTRSSARTRPWAASWPSASPAWPSATRRRPAGLAAWPGSGRPTSTCARQPCRHALRSPARRAVRPAQPGAPGRRPTLQDGFADRLDTVTAELAGDIGEFAGVRAMLIRPDGYIAWATSADDAPPLGSWLGHAR